MTNAEYLEAVETIVKRIETIYFDPWKDAERTQLIESLYDAGHVDWLIEQAKMTDLATKLSVQHQQKRKEAEDLNEPYRHENRKLRGLLSKSLDAINEVTHEDLHTEIYEFLYEEDD